MRLHRLSLGFQLYMVRLMLVVEWDGEWLTNENEFFQPH